jgi:hypothetical protein
MRYSLARMSDAPHDPLRATRLLLRGRLAARGASGPELDDERLRQLIDTGGPELRLIGALLETLEIAPGLLPTGAGVEEGPAPSRDPAAASLAANLLRMEASLPAVAALAPGDLEGLLPRVERALDRLLSATPAEAP